MSFKNKKIWNIKQYWSIKDILSWLINFKFVIKTLIILFFVLLIIYSSWFFFGMAKDLLKQVSKSTLMFASSNMWEEMQKDEFWQINVLIVWYWWWVHDWQYLTDTMMIASYDIKLWTISFLSVPRDLRVKYSDKNQWRLNYLFAKSYMHSQSLDQATIDLAGKLEEITWVSIKYYALVDFKWFISLVDKLWWLDIDVLENLVDNEYPTEKWWYTTFKIEKWIQHLDWEVALKYARSRHSTSDFSRALRQQQVIRAIITKVMSIENIVSINKLKEIYWTYNSMVKTNIWFKQILWMVKYMDKLNHFYSFVYTSECSSKHFTVMEIGCFLYYPSRDQFGWASVMLPMWATSNNVWYYKKMQDFAFFVVYNQKFLLENVNIKILNWIELWKVKKRFWSSQSLANDLAVEFKRYGFNITNVENTPWKKVYEKTIIYDNWPSDNSSTIDLMNIFVDINEVFTWDIKYGSWLTLILWNDYIDKIQ